MGEAILIFLIFGTVITITAVVFGGWLIFGVARTVFRVFSFVVGAEGHVRPARRIVSMNGGALPGTHPAICPNPQCHAPNRAEARFCRRCGAIMPSQQYAQVRRVAMW